MDTTELRTINPIRAIIVGILPYALFLALFLIRPRWPVVAILIALTFTAVLVSALFMRKGREAVVESVVAASVNTVIFTVIVLFQAWRFSPEPYVLLFAAVPLIAIVPLVVITQCGKTPRVAALIAAVVVIVWGTLHGLGFDLWYLIPGFSLTIAATTAFLNHDNHVMRH